MPRLVVSLARWPVTTLVEVLAKLAAQGKAAEGWRNPKVSSYLATVVRS